MPGVRTSSADKNIVDRTKRMTATTRMVKDLRQRVNQSSGYPVAFERELLVSYAQNHRNSLIFKAVFTAIVALFATSHVGYFPALYWLVVTLGAYGLMSQLSRRFLTEAEAENATGSDNIAVRWRKTFVMAHLLIAFCWTLFAAYTCPACEGPTYGIIQFSTILVLQAITMILAYAFSLNLLITSGPPTLVLAGLFMLTYQPAYILMGSIVLGSQLFFYFVAARFKLSVISLLEHQAEKENLIA